MQKAKFKSFKNYNDCGYHLRSFGISESCSKSYFHPYSHAYDIPLRASRIFFALVEIKTKKRNAIMDVDTLMRGAVETRLQPRFSKLADEIRLQRLH